MKESVYSAVIVAQPMREFTQFINILMSRLPSIRKKRTVHKRPPIPKPTG